MAAKKPTLTERATKLEKRVDELEDLIKQANNKLDRLEAALKNRANTPTFKTKSWSSKVPSLLHIVAGRGGSK